MKKTFNQAKVVMINHIASSALAQLRYNAIKKVSNMTPNVELVNVKRTKKEVLFTFKNDIRTITLTLTRTGGLWGTFNCHGIEGIDNDLFDLFLKNIDMIDIDQFAHDVVNKANQIIIRAAKSSNKRKIA